MGVIERWLNTLAFAHSESEGTATNYRLYMQKFCVFIKKTPEQILEEYEKTTDRKFKRKYAMLIQSFISENIDKYAVGTIGAIVSIIKSFFKYNNLPLAYIPTASGRVTYHNRPIRKEEIKHILDVSSSRQRAFFCMMAQSGLRPYTMCELRIKHVEGILSKDTPIPCKIDVPQEIAKGKYNSYFTFMGEASVFYLKSYLKERVNLRPDDYLFTKSETNEKISSATSSLSTIFKKTIIKLKKSGLMDFEQKIKGKPRTVRLYCLRKWFRSEARFAGYDYVNFWMGHKLPIPVDSHYFPRDVEQHRKIYAEKAMPYLRLWEATSKNKQDKEIETLKVQVEKLQKDLKKTEHFFQVAVRHREYDQFMREEAEEQAYQMRINEEAFEQYESEQAEKKAWELVKEMEKKKKDVKK